MTQNTEQNVRTREEQIADLTNLFGEEGTFTFVDDRDAATKHILEAEARGAEEQRRKDAEGGLRPMPEAKKDRTPILAKIHDDLFPRIYPERKDLKCWNGRWVVISHTGILADGFDIGWGVAAPVGCGGLTDDWFVGWKPVGCPANVAALEARIAELQSDNQRIRTAAEQVCSLREPASIYESRIALRAVLRSAGVPAPNPIQAMTDGQLSERLKAVQARWDALMESEEELGSGSPMESMDEEMQDLENEIARRAALTREGGV